MNNRINFYEVGQEAMKAISCLGLYMRRATVEPRLLNLIYVRVSQINRCPYCLDMHSKDYLADGGDPQHLFVLEAWRDAPFYSSRERAALAWSEQVTAGRISDEDQEWARKYFTDPEMIEITMAVITINCYNRINIAFPNPDLVGTYHPKEL